MNSPSRPRACTHVDPGPTGAPWAYSCVPVGGERWSLPASVRYCMNLGRSYFDGLSGMLSLFRLRQQEAIAAIYAFVRIKHDFAREPEFEGLRQQLLLNWEQQFRQSCLGEATHPVFIALQAAMKRYKLPAEAFLDLLAAARQDCDQSRYESFDELLAYCRRSANPVGRLLLGVCSLHRPEHQLWSDKLCTALQLTKLWQNISADRRRNRLYLPLEDLSRFRIPADSLLMGNTPRSFGALIRLQTERTRDLFREGRPLVIQAGYPGAVVLAHAWLRGRALLRRVRKDPESILHRRVHLSTRSFARTLLDAGWERLSVTG